MSLPEKQIPVFKAYFTTGGFEKFIPCLRHQLKNIRMNKNYSKAYQTEKVHTALYTKLNKDGFIKAEDMQTLKQENIQSAKNIVDYEGEEEEALNATFKDLKILQRVSSENTNAKKVNFDVSYL